MCPKSQTEKEVISGIPYKNAVGSLMYAMIGTRPDIAKAIGAASRFMANAGQLHWAAVKQIYDI